MYGKKAKKIWFIEKLQFLKKIKTFGSKFDTTILIPVTEIE